MNNLGPQRNPQLDLRPLSSQSTMDQPNPSLTLFQRANESANLLVRGLPQELRNPKVAIICGSGLGGLADTINPDPRAETPYHEIPDFPRSTGKSATITARVRAALKIKTPESEQTNFISTWILMILSAGPRW